MINGRAVVGIIQHVTNSNYFLVGLKKGDLEKFLAGQWHLPSETVEGNESDHDALHRLAAEELNIKITIGDQIATHKSPTGKDVVWYICFTEQKTFTAGSDLEKACWIHKDEVTETCWEIDKLWPKQVKEYFSISK
jgi:ADP-ribose pyrophosphatase YjhB (NUDIX family)